LDNFLNVLGQRINHDSHRMVVNVTSSPLVRGIKWVASQTSQSIAVMTQRSPSRCMTSVLKSWRWWRRAGCPVEVICSFKQLGSTKMNSSEYGIIKTSRMRKSLTSSFVVVCGISKRCDVSVVVDWRSIRSCRQVTTSPTNTEHNESQPFEWSDSQSFHITQGNRKEDFSNIIAQIDFDHG